GRVMARIVGPSGAAKVVEFTSSGEEWGAFASTFTPEEPGRHQVTLSCEQTGATLETSFFVQGAAVEPVGRPARPEVLDEIARVTRGAVLPAGDVDRVVDYLARLPEPEPSVRRLHLWGHPLTAGVVILLLSVFWIGRKAVGLI